MTHTVDDESALGALRQLAARAGLDVAGGPVRRSSSRFCLGVEHGDYNGTELFGVGTDRFIWLAYKPNSSGRVRLASANYPDDGVICFEPGRVPAPKSPEIADTWARFPWGVDHVLEREGFPRSRGLDVAIFGNIPGGGMSRSASLCLNLVLSLLDANGITLEDPMRVARLAQAVENDYVASPCGQLDQVMILFARAGKGTHYRPRQSTVDWVPLGERGRDLRLVALDTGTARCGLEKSTYPIRRLECEQLTALLTPHFGIRCLADVRSPEMCTEILERFGQSHPDHCDRLRYVYRAQQRFPTMLEAWKVGDIETVGRVFREDGIGLRDEYRISGPELEAMCDLARAVPGVLGERMLGGGDKGAAGALVRADRVEALIAAIDAGFPARYPELAEAYRTHVCSIVDGITLLEELL